MAMIETKMLTLTTLAHSISDDEDVVPATLRAGEAARLYVQNVGSVEVYWSEARFNFHPLATTPHHTLAPGAGAEFAVFRPADGPRHLWFWASGRGGTVSISEAKRCP